MTFHHVIRTSDLRRICPYCKKNLENVWESGLPSELNYRKFKCDCGRTISISKDSIERRIEQFETKEMGE